MPTLEVVQSGHRIQQGDGGGGGEDRGGQQPHLTAAK